MIKLKNLLNNSNCEEFEYGNDGSIKLQNFIEIYSNKIDNPGARISSEHSYIGMYSIEIDEGYSLELILPELKKNHKYIIMWKIYDESLTWSTMGTIFSVRDDLAAGEIGTIGKATKHAYYDAFMLIDLTNTFTNEGIPSINWLGTIPYCDSEEVLINEKTVKFLNIDDFTQNPENNVYYNDNDEVVIRFSIEDFDITYNSTCNMDYRTRIILSESYKEDDYQIDEYNGNDRKITTIYYGEDDFNENNIIHIKENNTYCFEVTLHCDSNSIGRQIEILGDNNLFGKQIVSYTIFNWRKTGNFNVLNTDIKYSELTDSPYMRTIVGETNPYLLAPTTIRIIINDILQSGVLITNKTNYSNMEFTKQVFLKDGNNEIKIQSVNIYGEVINENTHNINVQLSSNIITKEDLLCNFIGNDDQMIELKIDNADLVYHDKNAGMNKEVYLDQTVYSHFFTLEGVNSQYYRLDRKTPKIFGDIIRRPINVIFNGVEKEYDGTSNISVQAKDLNLNDGYIFNTVHDKFMSYSNTGFLKGSYENLYMKTVIYSSGDSIGPITSLYDYDTNETISWFDYNIGSNDIDYNSFEIIIDGDEGKTTSNGDVIIESIANKEELLINAEISKTKMLSLLKNKTEQGLYYTVYTSTLNNITKLYGVAYYGYALASGDIEVETLELVSNDTTPIEKQRIRQKLENWLKALDHKIYKVTLQRDELGDTHLTFFYVNNNTPYISENSVIIKYKYKSKTNKPLHSFKNADTNKVRVKIDSATLDNKLVSSEWKPIVIKDLQLTGGPEGNESKNYVISSYSAYGRIVKRGVIPHLKCLNKIYDGTPYVPFDLDLSAGYNGIEYAIPDDDIYIDDTYYGIHDNNFHLFKRTGLSYLEFDDANVGENKQVKKTPNIVLEGKDASNYYISTIKCNFIASIYKRKIEVVIDKLRFIRSSLKWEIDYHFINVIPQDHLTLSVNDQNGFKVYGGKSTSTSAFEIVDRFDSLQNSIDDIINMYFNYDFDNNYKFDNKTIDNSQMIEVYEPENTNTLYWTDDARIAEPNTKRIDINIKSNSNYPGEIKIEGTDLPYFESKDKKYRLYNYNKVLISGLNLSPQNPLSSNYQLLNNSYITTLEIV